MTAAATIARLREGGRIWALGALKGDDEALEMLAGGLLERWQGGDKLVVLGNLLGPVGNPARAVDWLLLRRRLLAMPGAHACDVVCLRGAQEEMRHKTLRLQFAMTPLDVLDWMLGRGLAAIVEAYGLSVTDGRIACRNGPSAIARWTAGLREQQALHIGHTDLLNALVRAALSADGAVVLSAAGVDAARPLDEQADAFWWSAQGDSDLDTALERSGDADWRRIARVVRGTGLAGNEAPDERRLMTVTRTRPALVVLAPSGALLDRIEA